MVGDRMQAGGSRYDGKVVVVTGAGRGLGRAMAIGFADAGADLVIASRTADDLNEVAAVIDGMSRQVIPVKADVAEWDVAATVVDAAVAKFGRIDVLVNNAGASFDPSSLHDISEASFDRTVDVNLKSTVRLTQLAAPHMPEGSAIVNISSTAATRSDPSTFVYAAAKAGVLAFTRAAAKELGRNGIRVNAIVCGPFRTGSLAAWLDSDPDAADRMAAGSPLGQIAEPGDIVGTALWMAGPDAGYLTGQSVTLDGGR